jgi:N-acyl-D-aspartate/D-glutamate deacylase
VFRDGRFREGYGQTVKSGRYLRAGARNAAPRQAAAVGA